MGVFEWSSELPVTAEDALAWHTRPGAFERLVPPWEPIEILDRSGDFETAGVVLRVPVGPLRMTWVAQHRLGEEPLEWIESPWTG